MAKITTFIERATCGREPRAEEQQSPFISAIGRQDEAASATSGALAASEPITFYWLIGTHFKFAPRKVALDKD